MDFRTQIDISPLSEPFLTHRSHIVMIGSCFSDEVGYRLQERLFNILINPQGPLYNPLSLLNAVTHVINKDHYRAADLTKGAEGLWHSFDHHSRFSHSDPAQVIAKINQGIDDAHRFLSAKDAVVCLTFGSARTFVNKESQKVVANCHKFSSKLFEVKDLTAKECSKSIEDTVGAIKQFNTHTRIILTVSPVRHRAYGLHEDKLSKAKLMLAVEDVIGKYDGVYYFPSYEIMMDDLRDYRFYADDMIHPSSFAVNYIFECFSKIFIPKTEDDISQRAIKLVKRVEHKTMLTQSDIFEKETEILKSSLLGRYPELAESLKALLQNR